MGSEELSELNFLSLPEWLLSSLQVLSHPETDGQPQPGGCMLTGRSNHGDHVHLVDQVHQAVREHRDVPAGHPYRPYHSQVCLAHL